MGLVWNAQMASEVMCLQRLFCLLPATLANCDQIDNKLSDKLVVQTCEIFISRTRSKRRGHRRCSKWKNSLKRMVMLYLPSKTESGSVSMMLWFRIFESHLARSSVC